MVHEPEKITLVRIDKKGSLHLLAFSNEFRIKATPSTVKQWGLTEGKTYLPDEFERLKANLKERHAYHTAETILAGRPYSVGEFKDRLRRKGIEKEYIDQIVKAFLAEKLLDDRRYAAVKVQSLMEHKPAGRSYLTAYLQNRRVSREVAEQVVDEALQHINESDIAASLLRRRRASFMKFDVETARRKAYNYLSRRGISYRAAKEAFENLFVRPRD